MRKRQLLIAALVLLVFVISYAYADSKTEVTTDVYSIGFLNNSTEPIEYHLYTDDPIKNIKSGELLPGESTDIDIQEGEYCVRWVQVSGQGLGLISTEIFTHTSDITFTYK